MNILALDLGLSTGWAISSAVQDIASGTAELLFVTDRAQGGGVRFIRFKQWLTETKHRIGGLNVLIYEQVRRHSGVDASHSYGGILAILTAWCKHHGIAYQDVLVGTLLQQENCDGHMRRISQRFCGQALCLHRQRPNPQIRQAA